MTPVARGAEPASWQDLVPADDLLREQVDFYRACGVIEDARTFATQSGVGHEPTLEPELVSALRRFGPRGDVLELACGSGRWTAELLLQADRVTAVDVAPGLLTVARRRLPDPRLRLLERDLFQWWPDRRYDVVFFAYWLCHVPASRFTWFWSWVERALKPTGRVFFIEVRETGIETGDPREVAGVGTVTHRRLWDGRSFSLVQNHYGPADLRERLQRLGWRAVVRAAGTYSLVGYGRRAVPAHLG